MMSIPLEIFCCYAREDQVMLEQLKKHLKPLEKQGLITIWSDTDLNAGVEWEKELHQHLESAALILLLISPDFMASDYCYGTEMKRAMELHDQGRVQVIPILLRPIDWQNTPFAKLQIIPTHAKPVSRWSDHDEAFCDITRHIRQVIDKKRHNAKHDEEAPITHEQAICLGPAAAAYNNKGTALKQLGREIEAQPAYEKARRLGPRSILYLLGMGIAFLATAVFFMQLPLSNGDTTVFHVNTFSISLHFFTNLIVICVLLILWILSRRNHLLMLSTRR